MEPMDRQNDIMRQSLGINYDDYEGEGIAFDYEAMMHDVGITIDEVVRIQRDFGVGNTPLMDLKNVTALARKVSEPGYGARILIKDEAANPSSFRAALSVGVNGRVTKALSRRRPAITAPRCQHGG